MWQPSPRYPDPAVEIIDPSFARYRIFNAAVERIATGMRWAEGPVWFGDGRYLLWSDIPNNRIMRWDEETGAVSVFRKPSMYANGNTRDRQGRLVSCDHGGRRITRTEYDGSITVLADSFQGRRLNSPNDVVVKSDGSIWFTDPPFGIAGHYEGHRAEPESPQNVYRLDPASGELAAVATDIAGPNGLCFSPDYKKLYVASTGKGPGDQGPGGKGDIHVFDVGPDNKPANPKLFSACKVDGIACGPDGLRCDVDGNVWASSNAGRSVGYSGVTVWNPDGKLIGRIRLPEVCGNVCFGGPKRNRLFMAASQSIYAVYVNTQGAAPG